MGTGAKQNRTVHFHIRWSGGLWSGAWDRYVFATADEAAKSAASRALPEERFTIVQYGKEDCPQCSVGPRTHSAQSQL